MNHDELLEALQDPAPEMRRDALDQISEEMDDELALAIVDVAAAAGDDEIRSDALIGLGPLVQECGEDFDEGGDLDWGIDLGPPISRDTFANLIRRIREIYEDDQQPTLVRRRALEVLVRDPKQWHRGEIRRHFTSSDPDWRLTAIFGMGWVTGFENELVSLLDSAKGVELAEAVRAAGAMGVTEAAGRVRALATSETADRDVRLEAIMALPQIDPDSGESLEQLARSRDREIAETARHALEELSIDQSGNED